MKQFITNTVKLLIKLFHKIIKILNKYLNYMNNDLKLKILAIDYNKSGRFLSFYLHNEYLFDSTEVLQAIFNSLMNNERFLGFGSKKVIITTALINGTEFSFHHNVLITNNTSFIEFYYKVKDIIQENYVDGCPVNIIPIFHIRV